MLRKGLTEEAVLLYNKAVIMAPYKVWGSYS